MSDEQSHDAAHAMIGESRLALAGAFAALRVRLEALMAGMPPPSQDRPEADSTLGLLADRFGLDAADSEILCLAAAAELAPEMTELIRSQTGGDRADVALAIALRPQDGWEAICPEAALRRWRLIELIGQGPILRRPIAVDERVQHFLMGVNYLDARLQGLVDVARPRRQLDAREQAIACRIAGAWTTAPPVALILLAGHDGSALREAAAHAAEATGLRLYRIDGADIPTDWTQRSALATYVDRELALSDGALLIESRSNENTPGATRLAEALAGPVVLAGADPAPAERAPRLRIELPAPARAERRALWYAAIGHRAEALGTGLDQLAEQFALDRSGIDMAVGATVNGTPVRPEALFNALWQAAREQARRRLDGLAERIESHAAWDDLVLPPDQTAQLLDLAAHVRDGWRVNEEWGWRVKSPRGLGAAALFAGPSGTGKTMAAEVLAAQLQLDLYRIDLSQVVSKYIGETEKNLSRIFDAAENGGAVLLFDEADALFGKRSEVKDAHDRYANIEVSYLLQKMEAYRGLAILTTNQKSALDSAFLRRLRYLISFPFPDAAARAEIWTRIFPAETPRAALDPARLARMNISGGSIRSIALNACFLAAGSGGPVKPEHVLRAARREYAKLDKPLAASEIGALI